MISVKDKKSFSSSIVLIGYFSPMMFQPYWFKHCDILNDDEFNAIEKKRNTIITDPLTVFETENLAFKIETRRFTIIAKKEPFELLIDTFDRLQEKLDSVLIQKFGFNFSFHLELKTLENFKKFGDVLAPKNCWSTFFSDALNKDDRASGLMTLIMRKHTEFGWINVKVESSASYRNAVFFDFNYHFDGNAKEFFDILDVNEAIDSHYTEFAEYADKVAQDLIDEVLGDDK